ncbi:MAG: 30S ribosomal protein S19e [Candidatus Nanoarchaeia archaeon]|nr:30S ribosomal protein S19e [Candidatus Nanoarchaeia archaeon]
MATVYDVNPTALIHRVKEKLKDVNEIKAPVWADFVKTGTSRQRPPVQKDWWYVRAAAVLRSIYCTSPMGVQRLRVKYGGKKRNGSQPSHFKKSSGNLLRKMLQQLESAGFLKKSESQKLKGRIITGKGKQLLDRTASEILKEKKQ